MELAGSAVGVASLGIQVCQGLLSYFDSWKGYNSDIDGVYSSIADLSRTLVLLRDSLQKGDLEQERSERVNICLTTCEGALRELSDRLRDLRKHKEPEGLRRKTWLEMQKLWYPFRTKTLDKLQANVSGIQERLKLALQVLQLDTETESRELLSDMTRRFAGLGVSVSHISTQNQRILDEQNSTDFRKLSRWLTPPDPWTNHDGARQRHQEHTGTWLLRHSQYQKWKQSGVGHLWLHGKAGCGKTILSSVAVEDVHAYCIQRPRTAYALFYFSFSDDRKQSDIDLLRSLVAQLSQREPGLSILRQLYENTSRSAPGLDDLEKTLLACIGSYEQVFVLMDALDECPDEHNHRENVLNLIQRLTSKAANLKIFATSREVSTILEAMKILGCESFGIDIQAVNSDIQMYVSTQLSSDRNFNKFDPVTRNVIEETLVAKADGM